MKREHLLKWIERLVELKQEYDECDDTEINTRLAHLLGYIESGEFIVKKLKKHE